MKLIKGAEVFSSVGEKIGLLERVVLDPGTKEVTHIVIRKGHLFTTNKVVPIRDVNRDIGKRIALNKTAHDLRDLPNYEPSSYIMVHRSDQPSQGGDPVYWYPPLYMDWWTSGTGVWYPKPEYVLRNGQVLPEGTIALDEGARVYCSDGREMGNVELVIVATPEERVTHIVVTKGLFAKEHKLIPTSWIKDVTAEKVYLSIDSSIFEHLPEHELVP